MTITAKEVEDFKRRIDHQCRTSTPAEAQARLIASGALKEDGSSMNPADYEEKWLYMR